MKDLTKVIDTLNSIKKVMGCMKEHTHDGITITTTNTEYIIDEDGICIIVDVENKTQPEFVYCTYIRFNLESDYIEVKDIIMHDYNRMCEGIRANMEEDKRVNIDESMR